MTRWKQPRTPRCGSGRARTRMLATALVGTLLTGCVEPFLGPAPDADDPAANFDALWTEFDRHYSFFQLKGVDWDALYDRYRPAITADMTSTALLDTIGAMLDHLEDGHVNVYAPIAIYAYTGWFEPYPVSFHWNSVWPRLTNRQSSVDGRVAWGDLSATLGYVHIGDFGVNRDVSLADVVADFQDKGGMIVDVRSNGGGSSLSSGRAAGFFTNARYHYRTVRYRNGPEHDDFTDPVKAYIEPANTFRFDGTVAVLTNRLSFSAAEDFVIAMRLLPQVTVVGDTTGGGAGNPIFRELPNGWTFRLTRWLAEDPNGFNWEGVGIPPDVWVVQTDADADAGRDPVLDAAAAALEDQLRHIGVTTPPLHELTSEEVLANSEPA